MISKPQPDEYVPYYGTYINLISNDEPILELLAKNKDKTYDFFKSIPDHKPDYAYADDKWTIKQVIGHMIDVERIFAYRLLCISRGDHQELPGFNDPLYVKNSTFAARTVRDLADEYKAVREANLYLFKSISEEQQVLRGVANADPVSVRAIVYIIAGHELHHLKLIQERYL